MSGAPFTEFLMRLPEPEPAPTNYVQVFHTPYEVRTDGRGWGRAFRFCSYCGRERGARATCDGCGAPSILVLAPPIAGYPRYSLEWWRERIASEPPPPVMEFMFEPFGPIRVPCGMPLEWDPVPGFRGE